jgi:hypothetical protein
MSPSNEFLTKCLHVHHTGRNAINGLQGIPGDQGPPGLPGPQGLPGDNGKALMNIKVTYKLWN